MRAWVRYWIPKKRPPRLPGGLRGPYDPRTASRDELLLMAATKAKTPQHARRIIEAEQRSPIQIALQRIRRPLRWGYKLQSLLWRLMLHSRSKWGRRTVPRLGVRYEYLD